MRKTFNFKTYAKSSKFKDQIKKFLGFMGAGRINVKVTEPCDCPTNVACTDGETLWITPDNPVTDLFGTDEGKLQSLFGIAFHEIGHLLYTDFESREKLTQSVIDNSWKCDTVFNKELEEVKEYINKYPLIRLALLDHILNITNIIEDIYMEDCLAQEYEGSVKTAITVTRQRVVLESYRPLSEELEKVDKEKAFISSIYDIANIGRYLKGDIATNEVTEALDEAMPFVDKAVTERNAYKKNSYCVDIFLILWKHILKNKIDEFVANFNKDNCEEAEGNSNAPLDLESALASELMDNEPQDENKTENRMKENSDLFKGDEGNSPESSSESAENDSEEGEGSSNEDSSDDSDASKEDSSDNSNGSSNNSKEENEGDGISDGTSESEDTSDTTSESDDTNKCSSNGADGNSRKESGSEKSSSDQTDNDSSLEGNTEAQATNETNTPNSNELRDTIKMAMEDIEGMVKDGEDLEDIKDNLSEQVEDELDPEIQKALEEEILSLLRSEAQKDKRVSRRVLKEELRDMTFNNYHQNIDKTINVIEEEYSYKETYNKYYKEISKLVRNFVNREKKFLQEAEEWHQELLFGSELDTEHLYNSNGKVWQKRDARSKPSIAISLLIDESGSMSGQKIAFSTILAIFMEAVCRELDIPLEICGHKSWTNDVIIDFICDFDHKEKDKYKIAGLYARGGNRDGAAVLYSTNRLQKRKESTKIFIIMSDGQPASGDYCGREAMEDLKSITKHLNNKGIKVIAGAIDEDKDILKKIYGKNLLDITDLSKMPKIFAKILESIIKNG